MLSSSLTGPAAPFFTDLTATSDFYDTATIQWTIPLIAYTPETYVVYYGTDMSTLDRKSDTVSSGNDFAATNIRLFVELVGLTFSTEYYYQLVANNTFASNSSEVMNFTTPQRSKFLRICICGSQYAICMCIHSDFIISPPQLPILQRTLSSLL